MLNEIMDRFSLWHYEDNDGEEEDGDSNFRGEAGDKEVNFLLNIVTYKPQTMEDVQEICDRFLDGDAVILYFEQTDEKCVERIVDFLSGAIYSQNGNILKISNRIYAISPADVRLF